MKKRQMLIWIMGVCLLAYSVCPALEIPGANDSDGDLIITANNCVQGIYTINLARAATKVWNEFSTNGNGVYDPEKWAIVFKYGKVQIDEGCTLKFVNHPANPPVYWLVSGDVTINGTINLDGAHGQDEEDSSPMYNAVPGPGGFVGGYPYSGNGFGPGGGIGAKYERFSTTPEGDQASGGVSASYTDRGDITATGTFGACYGDETLLPLIGGSGGSYYASTDVGKFMGGGAGGGAILIAAQGIVTLNGVINARGGRGGCTPKFSSGEKYWAEELGGAGSGGAVRILADKLTGSGYIDVSSWKGTNAILSEETNRKIIDVKAPGIGGVGRIRLDVNDINGFMGAKSTQNDQFGKWEIRPSVGNSETVTLWTEAKVTPLTLGGVSLPTDPRYRSSGYNECISFANEGERELVFQTENIPTNANVVVKVTPHQTTDNAVGTYVVATMDKGGTFAKAIWRAQIPLNGNRTTFQVLVSTTALYE